MTRTSLQRAFPALALLAMVAGTGCATAPKPKVEAAPPAEPAAAEPAAPAMPALHLDNVYFETGKDVLRPDARKLLMVAVEQLLADPERKIEIAGHCDERGTDDFNLDLGWKRAYAVRDFLVRQGVAEDRLFPISYGRARPAVPGKGEDAWQKNRRGTITPR